MSRDFIILLRMVRNLKLMICSFLKFPIDYFWTAVDTCTETVESGSPWKGALLHHRVNSSKTVLEIKWISSEDYNMPAFFLPHRT